MSTLPLADRVKIEIETRGSPRRHLGLAQPDEGAAAHIFQLSIVLWLVTAVTFITTADWTDPLRQLRRLAFPATIVALAFVALYYLEHAWYVHPI
jgi:phosphoglycerol transferase MdoB-like AlkP superfamily enzyme